MLVCMGWPRFRALLAKTHPLALGSNRVSYFPLPTPGGKCYAWHTGRFCSPPNVRIAHAIFDVVVIGADTRQTWLTTRLRGRSYQSSCQCPVERGATRVARHVRGRLSEVIPPYQRSNLRILSHNEMGLVNAGERDTPVAEMQPVGPVQNGCVVPRSTANPPAGIGPKPQGQSGARLDRFV